METAGVDDEAIAASNEIVDNVDNDTSPTAIEGAEQLASQEKKGTDSGKIADQTVDENPPDVPSERVVTPAESDHTEEAEEEIVVDGELSLFSFC